MPKYKVVATITIITDTSQEGKELQIANNRAIELEGFLRRHKRDMEAIVCSYLDEVKPIEVEVQPIKD